MKISQNNIPPFLQVKLPEIFALCRKHKLKKLWVFGSVMSKNFRTDSDVDFLYEMDDTNIHESESYDCFWGFYDALQALLERPIDMVWYAGIKNPYFKEEVDENKCLIYDKEAEKVSL
ncbi:MAG: nucleotidyltransferase domain-containing protein [Bacteroidota bacterium]